MKNPLIVLIVVSLLAVVAPQLFIGLAAAGAVGWWMTRRAQEATQAAKLSPASTKPRRRPIHRKKLQARVADQCRSENSMLRNHAREVARCLLGVKRSTFEKMSQDEVVEALMKAPRLA